MSAKWSEEQIQFMRDHYGSMSVDEFCEQLPAPARSRAAVVSKAQSLGLGNPEANKQNRFPKKVWVELPICKLATCLFRDYRRARQHTILVQTWEDAA